MHRAMLAALALCVPMAATAADDLKMRQMEQDIIRLQRDVQEQARQIEVLRGQLRAPAQVPPAPRPSAAAGAPPSTAWVDAAKWSRVQAGMGELDVIALLGPPTSLRREEGASVLLYALDIGANAFLAGSVTLRDGHVSAVQVPRLQ